MVLLMKPNTADLFDGKLKIAAKPKYLWHVTFFLFLFCNSHNITNVGLWMQKFQIQFFSFHTFFFLMNGYRHFAEIFLNLRHYQNSAKKQNLQHNLKQPQTSGHLDYLYEGAEPGGKIR